ncbi:MAG: aminopeptidase P family protein [Saprospiraceae bacterium]|nr:aminopeptidase P family protein [Saprospiraceae bacterium]
MQFRTFDQSVYIHRRNVLKQAIGSGIILFMGNDESPMNYRDNTYHFRQDSTFLYYFGLDTAGLAAIIDTETGDEIIFGNELTIDDIVWTGLLPSVSEIAAQVGVNQTHSYSTIEVIIQKALAQNRSIHFIPPYRADHTVKLAQWLNQPVGKIASQVSIPLIKAIINQRAYKEPREIAEIDKAVNLTNEMHLAAIQHAKAGMKEYEVVAKVHEAALKGGGNLSFPIILTVNGETLHNHYHGNTLKEGQMVLCDAGAENDMHYAGDLTRTFPVGKKFTPRQKDIYEIVLQTHQTAVSLLKPDILYRDIYIKACETLVEGLKSINLMKGNASDAVTEGAHAMFFQCGLGHMMGLDVHDMENLGEEYVGYTETLHKSTQFGIKSLRLGRALETGFVLTVEPGVYIIPTLIDQWRSEKRFKDFINYDILETYRDFSGIRIEENFVITEGGYQLLGKPLPKTINEIEALRQL